VLILEEFDIEAQVLNKAISDKRWALHHLKRELNDLMCDRTLKELAYNYKLENV